MASKKRSSSKKQSTSKKTTSKKIVPKKVAPRKTYARQAALEGWSSLLKVHSMFDDRLQAWTTLVALSIGDYLALTMQSEENLEIQRRILKTTKIYERLQKDLKRGGTIPPIVLAIAEGVSLTADSDKSPSQSALRTIRSSAVYIVDGLQRTAHLRQVSQQLDGEAREAFMGRPLRIEVWTDISFPAVLYRMMLLNAAQTPMTVRHQLEVVSLHLVTLIKKQVPGIEVFTEKSGRRRVQAKQFKQSDLIEAFTANVKRTPFTEAKTIIIEELDQDDFLEGFDEEKYITDLKDFIGFLAELDEVICNRYNDEIATEDKTTDPYTVRRGVNFFGTTPYLMAVAAAIGQATGKLTRKEFRDRSAGLVNLVRDSKDEDPLGFGTFNAILPNLIKTAGRIGDTQRDFVYQAFRSYFLDASVADFDSYWKNAARRI